MQPSNKLPNFQPPPHRDAVTHTQINNLLLITQAMLPMMLNPMREYENIPGATNPPGNARDSAEATFINACNRLDELLTDKSRWGLAYQQDLESKTYEAHAQNMRFLQAQTEAAEELTRPHFRFRPALVRLPNGEWVAILGDLEHIDNSLAGIGRTPAGAIASFDKLFNGELPPYMIEWLHAHEAASNNGQPSPPFPKKHNEPKKVDRKRNRTTERPPRGGHNPS